MEQNEDYFLSHNKLLEEKLDYCIHHVETRLDKLYEPELRLDVYHTEASKHAGVKTTASPFSANTYLHFKAPYIRDFRNFSGPSNEDVRQIQELTGTENIDQLIKTKSWSKESKQQLTNAVLDFYSNVHIVELIKQKNILSKQLKEISSERRTEIEQKLSLIEEQTEQVKARKEQRIFVPEDRTDPAIDWCAISAKLTNTHHNAQDCRLMWSNQLHWSINEGQWTKEEDVCLFNAVDKFGKNDWDSVAKELNSNRLPWQCCSRYHQEFTSASVGSSPITENDTGNILDVINLCRIGNFVPWNQVMYFVQYHSLPQVKYQWHKLLTERQSNQSWSHTEDVLLLKTVERFGDKDWNRISNFVPGRSNKSCRERYIMRLKFPKRAVGNWKRKEDEKLQSLIECFGTNWSLISSHFRERNSHQLRNRYELLKNEPGRVGPIKHRKLYRNSEGLLISLIGPRPKPSSDREVDEKLHEIFSTYQIVGSSSKSLICKSEQDDLIHQSLIQVIRNAFVERELSTDLLTCIIDRAIKKRVSPKYDLLPPCISTLRGYKAWSAQQDYLSQFDDAPVDLESITSTSDYHQVLKIVMSIFLWPAILSRAKRPEVDVSNFHVGSIIEKNSKNLYKVREIQKHIATPKLLEFKQPK